MEYAVRHDKINQQFITTIDGKYIYVRYLMRGDDTIDFNYTYVPAELRRRGFAEIVVRAGFKYAEENKLKVIPGCTYIHTFLERYPEYNKFIK